jgi:hypothetical protein
VAQMFAHTFERAYAAQGELDFWDYHGLSILPHTTLVANVGCGPEATHTTGMGDIRVRLPKGIMGLLSWQR